VIFQKSSQIHPQFYFNNLGVVHLKMKKYALAAFYFSKALKFIAKSEPSQKEESNPTKQLSHYTCQKSSEILYNMGIALFKLEKHEEAFKCFERAVGLLRHTPRLWYYMGLCCINLQ